MTSAYILIAAVLLLGGALAVLGDRLGTKVGKARLRLFNLRPRKTAALVTILTGTTIAASTLGILFALSESLRVGIFRLDRILDERNAVEAELDDISSEKARVESELQDANAERELVEQGLKGVQRRFAETSRQARELGAEVKQLRQQRQTLVQQIPQLQSQVRERDRTIRQRNVEISRQGRILSARERSLRTLQTEISRRDSRIRDLDANINRRDRKLVEGQNKLDEIGSQLLVLQQEITALEDERSKLRLGRVAIGRGDVLSFGVVRIVDPTAAQGALDTLLRQANRQAVEAIRRPLGSEEPADERVVLITQAQVEQIVAQIRDGRDYVVRILSAGNYVEGDRYVRVFADVTPNAAVFNADEVIATVSIEPDQMTPEERKERLDILLAASQFRARRAGILGDILIGDGSVTAFTSFLDQLSDSEERFDQLKAIAAETAPAAGPLRLRLVALDRRGNVIFRSEQ